METTKRYTEPQTGATQDLATERAASGDAEASRQRDMAVCLGFCGLILEAMERFLPRHLRVYLPCILRAFSEILLEGIEAHKRQSERMWHHIMEFEWLASKSEGHA